MNNLLASNFKRVIKLRKSIVLWIVLALYLNYIIIQFVPPNFDIANQPDYFTFQETFFNFAPTLGFFVLIFSSLFIGTEYSDSTLRNKIIIGCKRRSIYFANLITTFFVSFLFTLLNLLVGLVFIPVFGYSFDIELYEILLNIVVLLFMVAALSALFTLIAMVCSNKTFTLLISSSIFIALIMIASYIEGILSEPEMITTYSLVIDQVVQNTAEPNPRYIQDGLFKNILSMGLIFLPTGQALKIAWVEVTMPIVFIGFSAINLSILTLIGILFFKKKDLK